MKKYLLLFIGTLFTLAIINYNISSADKDDIDLTLQNIHLLQANANGEVPPDTYYCWYNFGAGVGFIRLCSACNIMPFASPVMPDGMCWTGSW
ncbi:MAG: hypothetical protein K0B11_14660 [Mariniphaga sp.]|nr:hypothetical protein [Mariniphaga sp.]